jgi:hypothetical protein
MQSNPQFIVADQTISQIFSTYNWPLLVNLHKNIEIYYTIITEDNGINYKQNGEKYNYISYNFLQIDQLNLPMYKKKQSNIEIMCLETIYFANSIKLHIDNLIGTYGTIHEIDELIIKKISNKIKRLS